MIHFDGSLPFSVEDFERDCERLLSPRDYAQIRIALGRTETDQAARSALAGWQAFEQALESETIRVRAQQLGRNPTAEVRADSGFDVGIAQAVAQAFKTEDLLEAQRLILRLKWDRLDELALNQDFSLDAILSYGLRLQILEQLNAYKTRDGHARLEEIMGKAVKSEQ